MQYPECVYRKPSGTFTALFMHWLHLWWVNLSFRWQQGTPYSLFWATFIRHRQKTEFGKEWKLF